MIISYTLLGGLCLIAASVNYSWRQSHQSRREQELQFKIHRNVEAYKKFLAEKKLN